MAVKSIKDVAQILANRKDLKPTHGIIIYLIEKYLEANGLVKGKDFKVEEYVGDLELDIATIDGTGTINIIWEVLEPDPIYNIRNKEFLEKIERLLIRTYSILLKPKYIILTDGKALLVYDSKGKRIDELSTMDLTTVDETFEEKFKKSIGIYIKSEDILKDE